MGILVNVKFENLMKNNSYGKIKNFSTRLIVQTEGGNKNGKLKTALALKTMPSQQQLMRLEVKSVVF